jgi:hypothetical protein
LKEEMTVSETLGGAMQKKKNSGPKNEAWLKWEGQFVVLLAQISNKLMVKIVPGGFLHKEMHFSGRIGFSQWLRRVEDRGHGGELRLDWI